MDEGLVVQLVRQERNIQPRLGTRKLHHILCEEWLKAGVSIGRDRLFGLLRRHDLLILRRRRYARTTDSRHGLPVYPNLLRQAVLTGPHQAWVSDITYLRTREGFMYLSMVMDAFSRKIVGYDCHDRLESEGALRALSMAMGQLPAEANVIHHSGLPILQRAIHPPAQAAKNSNQHDRRESLLREQPGRTAQRDLKAGVRAGRRAAV